MKRIVIIVVLSLCLLYFCDYISVRYKIPRSREPLGTVAMQTSYAVKQKSGKTEFYFNPPENLTCVHSLFPHLGYSPCWYLNRKNHQQIKL